MTLGSCYTLFTSPLITKVMLFISYWGNGMVVPLAMVIATVSAFLYFKKPNFAAYLLYAVLFGELIKQLLKNTIKRPRPGLSGCLDIAKQQGFSFPSGHTIFYTIFFGFLAWYLWKEVGGKKGKIASIFPIIMVLSVGYSRIYLGAHWLTDVIAGYLIGGLILFGIIKLIKKDEKNN